MNHRWQFAAAIVLCLSLPASAAFELGPAVPLTNTRYAARDAYSTLTTNGRDFFLVWQDAFVTRITQIGVADPLVGRPVLTCFNAPATVFTGDYFLVVCENLMRVLDSRGTPIGEPFKPTPLLQTYDTALATNGRNVLLFAGHTEDIRAYVLSTKGVLADSAGQLIASGQSFFAVASNGTGYAAIIVTGNAARVVTFDENGVLRTQQTMDAAIARPVAIASDGRAYLAAWSHADGSVRAIRIEPDGTLGAPFFLASPGSEGRSAASMVWTGSHYSAAITSSSLFDPIRRTEVVLIGSNAAPSILEGNSYRLPSLAAAGTRIVAAWGSGEGTMVRDLSAATEERPTRTAWSANSQYVFRGVTGNDATLVLWSEQDGSPRMGIRGRNGSWVEQKLEQSISKRLATDGTGFLIAEWQSKTSTATYYSADGAPRWTSATIPFTVEDIVWNGRDFILAGQQPLGQLVAVRLSSSGALSSPVALRTGARYGSSDLATDGNNVLVTWAMTPSCVQPCYTDDTAAMLFDRDLRALQPHPIELGVIPQGGYPPQVAWDGAKYVVVVSDSNGLHARQISREGVLHPSKLSLTNKRAYSPFEAASISAGTAVLWTSIETSLDEARIITRDFQVSSLGTLPGTDGVLLELPDRRLGYFSDRTFDSEPYYGSQRLTLSVIDTINPARPPDAPKVAVKLEADRTLRLEWTAPPQPVNGYRVEYKIGKQEWMEFELWLHRNQRSLSITPTGNPFFYSFRVRAWSDSGTSAYSAPASPVPGKRRSVR